MTKLSTHVLDISRGQPAAGLPVRLEVGDGADRWVVMTNGMTHEDGRVPQLLPDGINLEAKRYRLTFDTGTYFRACGEKSFYPIVTVHFEIADPAQHYHVPLLLSPFGYSTYRGS